ncbi:MAG TPA: cytidylate kinase-like family protein [Thermodesulfobacteriota bacterium]|nr:cytidylate kinase-like family protein [Thermodesulfobacteriota bacterium]
MHIDNLVPNIDRRLSSWISVQDQLKKDSSKGQKPTITLSRKFGSEAYPLAEILKDLLEKKSGDTWTIFDKALIEKVSQETALSERLFTSLSMASKALEALASIVPGMASYSDAYKILTRYVVRIAMDGNAIIIGRGGAVLAQKLPNCFHFRLEAPVEYRVDSIRKRLGCSLDEAKKLVAEREKTSDKFIESLLNRSMQDPLIYHAVFNTNKSSLANIAKSILALMFERG